MLAVKQKLILIPSVKKQNNNFECKSNSLTKPLNY